LVLVGSPVGFGNKQPGGLAQDDRELAAILTPLHCEHRAFFSELSYQFVRAGPPRRSTIRASRGENRVYRVPMHRGHWTRVCVPSLDLCVGRDVPQHDATVDKTDWKQSV